jgi:hypothetical protein
MSALIRAELLKLRTVPTTAIVLVMGLTLTALLATVTISTAGQDGSAPAGSAADLANVLGASSMPALIMFVLGVLAMAGEFSTGPSPRRFS